MHWFLQGKSLMYHFVSLLRTKSALEFERYNSFKHNYTSQKARIDLSLPDFLGLKLYRLIKKIYIMYNYV